MNLELFIARRLVTGKESKGYVSRAIVRFTTIGISLGLAVMIISVAVVTGFKKEISNKIIGFGAHIQIENYDSNASFETRPISSNQKFMPELRSLPGLKHIQTFGIKAGIIKTDEEIQGVVLKGVDKNYDWTFFKKNLIDGNVLTIPDSAPSNQILISKTTASSLKLKTGDDVGMYFVQNPPRVRRFKIAGIYETGLEEFDKIYVIGDIRHVRKLNDWDSTQISGLELSVNDFSQIDKMKCMVENIVGLDLMPDGSALKTSSIKDKNTQLFDWLNLVNLNAWIILFLMLLVAGFNMVSSLMILILERTNMIGLLTSLGAQSVSIRRIFIFQSGFLILKGLLWGNLIGLGLCFLQYHFKIIKLNQSLYFLSSVPINFNLFYFLLLNIGTLIAVLLMLIIPSMIISRISPDSTLRYN
ncbi:MAG: ABC transporter permease [Bacteroidota bacterium]|nr:ABC transporter permease [Bacteroidota bacterium]